MDAVTWRIAYQTPGYSTAPGSGVVKGVTLGLVVNDSLTGEVFVPDADFGKQSGYDLVNAEAQKIAAVQGWTHTNSPGA